ncbi:MAG: aldo/keto reductase family protein [Planctomycetota bacterium]|jgi:voltage-dependent potassium channel beta subunit|nr:aldo/keto reductase family protein [Planctomycetota bacterium]MDP6764364.1 aldo/keto reductase family protein [Planctomycetota bacterium]MDP6988122.1 aldo/keto reductase family protein [Planctomycetota bacterium]
MKYRRLGESGLRISEVSIGGWITFGGSVDEATARDVVHAAVDEGINFIDLADVYAHGEAERVVGRMLSDFRRADLVLSSKCFWPMSDSPNDRGLSRKHLFESVERSLSNLGTDYLDLFFCHREDPETPLEETVCALTDLVRQGKLLHWGTSVWSAKTLERASELAAEGDRYAPRVEQPRYNLFKRDIEHEVLPTAVRLGMGVVVWSPLAGGLLTGKYNDGVPGGSRASTTEWMKGKLTEENLDRVRRLCEVAGALEVTPSQLALAWVLARPGITSVITGATHPDQVRQNVGAVDIELTPEVAAELEDLFPLAPAGDGGE